MGLGSFIWLSHGAWCLQRNQSCSITLSMSAENAANVAHPPHIAAGPAR